jgi:hypothetical protein
VAGGWELLKMRSILIYTADQMLLGSRQAGWDGSGKQRAMGNT